MARTRPDHGVRATIKHAERLRRRAARESSGLRHASRRAVWVFAFLCAGLLLGRTLGAGAEAFLFAGAAGAILALRSHAGWARAALAMSVVCAGAGWYVLRIADRPATDLSRALTERPALMTVEGVIETSPRITSTQRGSMLPFARNDRRVARFSLRVARAIDGNAHVTRADGRLYVRIDGPIGADPATDDALASALPGAGTWVRITGFAGAIRAPSNPGEMDFRPVAAGRGIAGSIRCASPDLVEPIDAPDGLLAQSLSAWLSWKDAMRATARHILHTTSGQGHTRREALLGALLLGERSGQYDELAAPFVRLGVSHVLAISGLHVGIFAGFVALLVRFTGDRWRTEALAVLFAIALMMILIPARAPVVRAWAIIGGFAIAGLFGRRYDSLSTLAWIGCAVLLWRPTELWNPGFQLSFLIVGALIALTGPVRDRLFGPKRDPDHRTARERLGYRAEDALCASGCAWAVSLPLVMQHFGIVTLLAPLVSLLIIPLVGALLIVGYAAIGTAWFVPSAATWLSPALAWISAVLLDGVAAIDTLPGATFRVPAIGWPWAGIATLVIWVVLLRGAGRTRARRIGVLCALAALAAWPLLAGGAFPRLDEPDVPPVPLLWTTIDVGDGSAHVLTSDGHSIMFDCGSNWYGIGERTIPEAARAVGAWRISTVVISHPDLDHYAGLLDCVEPLGVREVLIGRAFADEAASVPHGPSALVLDELRRRGVEVHIVGAGDGLSFGGARLQFISPSPGFEWDKDNDSSLVALVRTPAPDADTPDHETRLLLCADIERDAMAEVQAALDSMNITHIDAMTAPHHGSARPFAYDFVESLTPRLVVQSTGPSRLADERWDGVKATIPHWLITARDGAITTAIEPDGAIQTKTWRRN